MITTLIQPLDQPLDLGSETWKRQNVFDGSTPNTAELSCHRSILAAGECPHPPHTHDLEEILVVLDGEADLVLLDGERERTERVRAGGFAFYPANLPHTIRAGNLRPVEYLMFRWTSPGGHPSRQLETTVFPSRPAVGDGQRGREWSLLFEGPTNHLAKLHCHLTTLPPGTGYEPHVDAHDVGILVLSGRVETLGSTVEAPAIVFYAAGQSHGMRSVGDAPAQYLVFEFHGERAIISAETRTTRGGTMDAWARRFAHRALGRFPGVRRMGKRLLGSMRSARRRG